MRSSPRFATAAEGSLTEGNASQLAKKSIEYDTGFTLAPGKYSLKFPDP